MHKFINLRDGRVNVTSYRSNCLGTTLKDIIVQIVARSDECLTASFDAAELCEQPWAYEFLEQHGIKCGSRSGGTELLYLFADEQFTVFTDNTSVISFEDADFAILTATVRLGWGE